MDGAFVPVLNPDRPPMNARTLAACALVALALPAQSAVVVLNPSQDATLYQSGTGSLAGGAGPDLFVGATANGSLRRALLQFDIAAAVPEGATIDGVSLSLQADKGGAPSPVTVELFRLSASWTEGTVVPPGNGGGGGTATTGSATWLHRSFNGSAWASAGGDFAPGARGSFSVSSLGPVTASSSGLAEDVQGWLNNPAGNFGWAMIGGESLASSAIRFDSSEGSISPALTINYTIAVPEPGTASLLVLGGIFLAARRRQ